VIQIILVVKLVVRMTMMSLDIVLGILGMICSFSLVIDELSAGHDGWALVWMILFSINFMLVFTSFK
jgi:hypothetical protein